MAPFDAKYLRVESFHADSHRGDYKLSPVGRKVIERLKISISHLEDCQDVVFCTRETQE